MLSSTKKFIKKILEGKYEIMNMLVLPQVFHT